MKVNKITTIICFGIAIILSIPILLNIDNQIIMNISYGLFTGTIVSAIISLIAYFSEKEKLISLAKSNLNSLYLNLLTMSNEVGKNINLIFESEYIEEFHFKNAYDLSELNIKFISNINLEMYSPFYPKSRTAKVFEMLKEFKLDTYIIRKIAFDLNSNVLIYDLEYTESKPNISQRKNAINIRNAKFHEYLKSKIIEIDKIGNILYKQKKNNMNWNNIKNVLCLEAEDILKNNNETM